MEQDASSVAPSFRSLPKGKVIMTMVGVLLAMFMSSLDQTIVDTALPRIMTDLNGFSTYTWVVTVYIITSAFTVPIVGKLTDMYGRKRFYIGGIILFTIASVFSGLSRDMTQLIIARGIQGLGAGAMMANSFTVIADIFPPAERGKYQGIISAVFGLSAILGPLLGGIITDQLSWHWIFFVNIPLGIFNIVLFWFFFPDLRPQGGRKTIDYLGMATLSLGVMSLLLAFSLAGERYEWLSLPVTCLLGFFLIMFVCFLVAEKRSSNPIIPLALFRNRIVSISYAAVFLTAFGMYSAITFIPLFFQGVLGTTATISGSFLTPMMLGQVAGSFVSGQFLSRTGGHYRMQGLIGLVIMCVGLFFMTRLHPASNNSFAILSIVLTGIGVGSIFPVFTIAVQNAVQYRMLGVTTSTIPFIRLIGASVGLSIFGSILTNRFATDFTASLPQDVTDVLSSSQVMELARNPRMLLDLDAQQAMRDTLLNAHINGEQLFEHLMQTLQAALSSALKEIFLIALLFTLLGFVVYLFIKEIPLRKDHGNG